MNGWYVAGATAAYASAGLTAWALRWALAQKRLMPTVRVLLMFVLGCCISAAFAVWIVRLFSWASSMWEGSVSREVAGLIIAVPGAVVVISAVFTVWALKPKNRPEPRDEIAALVLPIALLLGVTGALGAVGDTIRVGTANAAVTAATALVGGTTTKAKSRPIKTMKPEPKKPAAPYRPTTPPDPIVPDRSFSGGACVPRWRR
jgi:hypothetical protein